MRMNVEQAERVYDEIEGKFPHLSPVICKATNGIDEWYVVDTDVAVVSSPEEINLLAQRSLDDERMRHRW